MILNLETPRWAVPLLSPARYKGAKGGRSSGKSHFMAEMLVEEHVYNQDQQSVCIREIQKSLKFSAKKLVEDKIRAMGVIHLFDITLTEIRRKGAEGIIIFQGMQDHTADSIKSLEGFDRAWVEEAQSMSHRSLELLIPTIRNDGSEIWFSWNPDQPTDAVEQHFTENEDATLVHVNYIDNPWCPYVMLKEAKRMMKKDVEKYDHIWAGGFNKKSKSRIFQNARVDDFEAGSDWSGPYQGMDFGFSQDPSTCVKCWIYSDTLYIEYDGGQVGLDLDKTTDFFKDAIPGIEHNAIRADSARPESISYLSRHGLSRIEGVKKWPGSVEDGIEHIKSYNEVVIHSRCKGTQDEARMYSYVVDKKSGDITDRIEDKNNHYWDAIRYALQPMIKNRVAPNNLKIGFAT